MTAGILAIPRRLCNGRDITPSQLLTDLQNRLVPAGVEPPLLVFLDDNDRVICDCQPYTETGECEHWREIGR